MMKVEISAFILGKVTNPETGEVLEKVRVELIDGRIIPLFHPNHEVAQLKKQSETLKKTAMLANNEYGDYVYFPAFEEQERF